jgi:hypothetical protein
MESFPPAYLAWRAGTTTLLSLASINVYKFGLYSLELSSVEGGGVETERCISISVLQL